MFILIRVRSTLNPFSILVFVFCCLVSKVKCGTRLEKIIKIIGYNKTQ